LLRLLSALPRLFAARRCRATLLPVLAGARGAAAFCRGGFVPCNPFGPRLLPRRAARPRPVDAVPGTRHAAALGRGGFTPRHSLGPCSLSLRVARPVDVLLSTRHAPRRRPARNRLGLPAGFATALVSRRAYAAAPFCRRAFGAPSRLYAGIHSAGRRARVRTVLYALPGVVIAARNALVVQPAAAVVTRPPVVAMAVALAGHGIAV
jgi:hypothetical protein